MPIRWSALQVSEAMDMAEEFINQAAEPLEQAKLVAVEARNIANLPGYVDERLASLKWDIERCLERLRSDVASVRKSIPDGAVEAEQESARQGNQLALV
jgi:hypothetical protein